MKIRAPVNPASFYLLRKHAFNHSFRFFCGGFEKIEEIEKARNYQKMNNFQAARGELLKAEQICKYLPKNHELVREYLKTKYWIYLGANSIPDREKVYLILQQFNQSFENYDELNSEALIYRQFFHDEILVFAKKQFISEISTFYDDLQNIKSHFKSTNPSLSSEADYRQFSFVFPFSHGKKE